MLWSRIINLLRRERLFAEIDEEFQAHLDEAIEQGRDPDEVRRAFGTPLRLREQSSDFRLLTWADSIRADIVFTLRQIQKNPAVSAAAILSLALALGACTAAFRIIDALLLRPMPVRDPGELYVIGYPYWDASGKASDEESFDYPQFRQLRSAVKDQADLIAIAPPGKHDLQLTMGGRGEHFFMQYVSGWMFQDFGLHPVIGRLLTPRDDVKPGGNPVAVLSYDFWARRFGCDPKVVGKKYFYGTQVYEIVGVSESGFSGTEPGILTDIFVPTTMNEKAINNPHWGWFRIWVRPHAGVEVESLRAKIQAAVHAWRSEHIPELPPGADPKLRAQYAEYAKGEVILEPAAAGFSGLQKDYRRALLTLGGLLLVLLLIACANLANLMTARAAARSREMAIRVSMGAGRLRLVRLVLTEALLLALLASLLGAVFAWWSAPAIISQMNPPDNPIRLVLPADLRVLSFAVISAFAVTVLFGIMPALRASAISPMNVLRGETVRSRRRTMNLLIGGQVALCFLVQLLAGCFITSFERLSHQPVGFDTHGLLAFETATQYNRPSTHWDDAIRELRSTSGVQAAAVSSWAPMSGYGWSEVVLVNGNQHGPQEVYFLAVSPGWFETMHIPLFAGRDFRFNEGSERVAIVNASFAKRYFEGANPIGHTLTVPNHGVSTAYHIVGYVADSRYRDMRETMRPTVYILYEQDTENNKDWATFMVHASVASPLALASQLTQAIRRGGREFGVVSVIPESNLVNQHTIRERLLAHLAAFFGAFALILSGIGLYGVLTYTVLQQKRDISIRVALGAWRGEVVRRVISDMAALLVLGGTVGLVAGVLSQRYLASLLFEVNTNDTSIIGSAVIVVLVAALISVAPPLLRALQLEPATVLRAD